MTFGDMQNLVLARLRQRGVNWGGAPGNVNTDFNPPYEVALMLNTAYNDFLSRTKDYPISTVELYLSTAVNQNQYSMGGPIGQQYSGFTNNAIFCPQPQYTANATPQVVVYNPAIMRIYEFSYIQTTTAIQNFAQTVVVPEQERYIPSLSSNQFRSFTGAYTQRYGAYAAYPRRVTQLYGQRRIDLFPGTATGGDWIKLVCTPDPQRTAQLYSAQTYYLNPLSTSIPPATVAVNANTVTIPCYRGGPMVNATDEPIMPAEYHPLLVYFATALLSENSDKIEQGKRDMQRYLDGVEDAKDFGASTMEGESEQRVVDPYVTAFDIDAAVL